MNYFFSPSRKTTTAIATQYYAVKNHAAGGVPQRFPNPACIVEENQLCFWKESFGSSTLDISVTNCGKFFVYLLQPTMTEALKRSSSTSTPLVYWTTKEENVTRGNDHQIFFFLMIVDWGKEKVLFLLVR